MEAVERAFSVSSYELKTEMWNYQLHKRRLAGFLGRCELHIDLQSLEEIQAATHFLAGLRLGVARLGKRIRMEMKQMGAYINIQENVLLRDIWKDGLAKGLVKGKAEGAQSILFGLLEETFGVLPSWATARLRKASSQQIRRWIRKVLTAATLEVVIGRRSKVNRAPVA